MVINTIPRRKQKLKYSRKNACKHLEPKGDYSNSLQPLCYCPTRDLVLGTRAYVCQVCSLYSQTERKTSEVYEQSKILAEKRIKEKELDLRDFELEEEEVDLTIEEFEEEEEELPTKYEKRKAGKDEIVAEDLEMECPYCGEVVEDIESHLEICELAPEDADVEDIISAKLRKKKKVKKVGKSKERKGKPSPKESKEKMECPYCGKQFTRLARHLPSCSKRPEDVDEEKENSYIDGKIGLDEFQEK